MNQSGHAALYPGVAQKADAIVGAIIEGHSRIAAIAEATRLPETTVIRVAGLLRERGLVGVDRSDGVGLVLTSRNWA